PLVTTPPDAPTPPTVPFVLETIQLTFIPADDQTALPRASPAFTLPLNAAIAAITTRQIQKNAKLTKTHTTKQLRGGTGLTRWNTCISLYLLGFKRRGGFHLLRGH